MATYGKVKAFNPKVDNWEVYEEQLRFFMAAKKRSILLTVCGDQTFKLLQSLMPDGKLDADDVTYNSLVGLLKSNFTKKQSVVVHRFNFNIHVRRSSKSIADYVAALRELAMHCNFGAKECLEEMLRDRLVWGVNHQASSGSCCPRATFRTRTLWPLCSQSKQQKMTPRSSVDLHLCNQFSTRRRMINLSLLALPCPATVVVVLTWLLPVHT